MCGPKRNVVDFLPANLKHLASFFDILLSRQVAGTMEGDRLTPDVLPELGLRDYSPLVSFRCIQLILAHGTAGPGALFCTENSCQSATIWYSDLQLGHIMICLLLFHAFNWLSIWP
jgi:hypothetical protein